MPSSSLRAGRRCAPPGPALSQRCVTVTHSPRRRIRPHPPAAGRPPLGIMISAGCGVPAAGRELSAPRPLRTDARLPAEEKEATNKTQ
ncbi:Hypothetical predicted protein [Marmota monax]|uniref:Uncharacterized protein n=1 Tax=Marmota monax TaxID=9995 RepID=A0A5E4B9V2_MARMO|nr:Hypothetical predicted protein [Marmota monax]